MEPKSLKIKQWYSCPTSEVICCYLDDDVLSASTENIEIDTLWTWDE